MRTISHLFIILIIMLLAFAVCPAGNSNNDTSTLEPDSFQEERLFKSLAYVYSDSFTAAIACVDSLIKSDSCFWSAYVFKAGIIYTEMNDNENYNREKYFKALIDTSLEGLDYCLKKNPNDKWAMFFKGTAMGYLAVWEGHQGSWLKAVFKGINAGKLYSKAAKQDSLFYEAYIGLGTLHYWRSAKMGIIRKLPFIADRREQGIEELKLAVEKSRFSSSAAAAGLAWIYLDQKENKKAIEITDWMIKQGYSGRQVLWPRAIAYFKMANANGTIENFTLIRDGLLRKGDQNYQNLVICGYCLGRAYYWKGDLKTSLEYFDEILGYELSSDVAKKVDKKLKDARKYKSRIEKKIKVRGE